MSAIFITATGTDIGKTFVTAGLIRHLRKHGKNVDALKPVATGFERDNAAASDTGVLLAALQRPLTDDAIARVSPWRFAAPLSPDMAAAQENRSIAFDDIVAYCRRTEEKQHDVLLIEGIGGVMVPLDDRHTVLDWMAALNLPVLLVTGSYLGSLSHTLTALDALTRRQLTVKSIVVNETAGATVPLPDTVRTIERFAACPVTQLRRSPSGEDFAALAGLLGL